MINTKAPLELAPISTRWLAFSIDMTIGVLFRSFIEYMRLPNIPLGSNGMLVTSGVILVVVSFVYFCVLPLYLEGRTIGKALLKIRIMPVDDKPLTVGRLFIRNWAGYIVSGLPMGLGFFWAFSNNNQQTWHDIAAATVVVDERQMF